MEATLAAAEILITRWEYKKTTIKMLFQSTAEEVRIYMETVDNLQRLMEYLSAVGTDAAGIIRAQRLMKMAMTRLEKEFQKILVSNSEPIDPDRESSARPSFYSSTEGSLTRSICSDGDDNRSSFSSSNCLSVNRLCEFDMVPLDAVVDLRRIAQRMAKSGYASESIRVFVLSRKSVVEESLYNLGVDKVTVKDVRKMKWEFLDEKIKKWIHGAKISIRILVAREKRLCEDVFEGLDKMRDACFAEIAKETTRRVFALAEGVAATSLPPERIFRVLDLYEAVTDLMPDIEATYCQNSFPSVHEHKIVTKLGEAARGMLKEFDKAIEKENSKAASPGGIIHPLTRYVMNYLTFLSDYKETLVNITADVPEELPKRLPDDYAVHNPCDPLSVHLGWAIFLLLCKLVKKSDRYKVVALSYLFLMNNLHYIVQKVNGSKLKYILGEDWVRNQWNRVRQYALNYERSAWMKVLSSITDEEDAGRGGISSGQGLKEKLKGFNSGMEEVKRRHSGWVVPDVVLREKLGISITEKLVQAYSSFLTRFRSQFESDTLVKYTPEEVQDFVLDIFKDRPLSVSFTRS
ncbi:hypothetical protein SUGI_0030360 [Cryptomeria japonica]|uniref:exocyst complex component EXO70H1-like n=1 Tax=Cryptomeria japonica TaxID=3369 RepID=UPI00240895FB|nr:exocyst complex component EXO70H1-like [Cryptomeria japonica]GLJ06017.1 hypothetical protein SUGI_0030360 [Cryptomeria japonica]